MEKNTIPQYVCPVCLQGAEQLETDRHHVIPRADGGDDHPANILPICKTCHAIISFGKEKHRHPRAVLCHWHQLGTYGLMYLFRFRRASDERSNKAFEKLVADIRMDIIIYGRQQAHERLKAFGRKIYFKEARKLNKIKKSRKSPRKHPGTTQLELYLPSHD